MAKQMGCSISDELQKEIDGLRGLVSRSRWVSMLLKKGLDEYKREQHGDCIKKMFLLEPVVIDGDYHKNWGCDFYFKVFSMVIKAKDEESARQFAAEKTRGREGGISWTDTSASTCKEILCYGDDELIAFDICTDEKMRVRKEKGARNE